MPSGKPRKLNSTEVTFNTVPVQCLFGILSSIGMIANQNSEKIFFIHFLKWRFFKRRILVDYDFCFGRRRWLEYGQSFYSRTSLAGLLTDNKPSAIGSKVH